MVAAHQPVFLWKDGTAERHVQTQDGEVWRYDGERVHSYALEGQAYREIDESAALPPMTAAQATFFLELDRKTTAAEWDRAVREWIRSASLNA